MNRIIKIFLILPLCLLLAGCGYLTPGLTEYTTGESGDVDEVDGSYQGEVYEMSQEEHFAYELSDDFYTNGGFDMDRYYEILADVREAAEEISEEADAAESSYDYWVLVMKAEADGWITEEEFDAYAQALYDAIEDLAEQNSISLDDFLSDYGISSDELIQYTYARAQELLDAYEEMMEE